jgi:hydroxymethylpyrimidine pyrophosphatase-like HAD family hydrolase
MVKPKRKHNLAKVIAVDVDGTLLINGSINQSLVEWCISRKDDGFCMILWSARGEKHAKNICKLSKLETVFDYVISKPAYVVDDKGWSWTKYTKVIDFKRLFAQ